MKLKTKLSKIIKKISILSVFILICFTLIGCNKDKQTPINNAIALGYKDDIPYLINDKGETYSLERYDSVVKTFGEYITVELDNKFGYIDRTGKEIIEPQYDEAYLMRENKAVVKIDNSYHIINTSGDIIYTFENNIFSTNYFSENFLVIEQVIEYNHYFGYLKYDPDTNSFSILNDQINYDYCSDFKNGNGIIGVKKDEDIKYTYICQDGTLLFDNLYFDEARYFYCDNACVGFEKEVLENGTMKKRMTYKYIQQSGEYLKRNKKELEFQHATDFSDDYAFVGNYYYSYSQQVYFKKYEIIDHVGNKAFVDPLYYAGAGEESVGAPANFWPTPMLYFGYTNIFSVRMYGAYGAWSVKQHKDGLFISIPTVFSENDKSWLKDLSEILGIKNGTTSLAENYCSNPYYMEALRYSAFYSLETPITCVRVFGSDCYGIIQVNYDSDNDSLSLSYVIAPIYDELYY